MEGQTVLRKRYLSMAEVAIIVVLACVPLFVTFPYRVNIFLSWEGAYRMSGGQLPFRDFGTPMGGMYWVIPAIFFKIFGAKMITLIKAQVFINIISGLAFRSILKSCKVQPGIRLMCVIIYCLSYSFFNFWPWYNHTVIVYEFVGLAFLMKYLAREKTKYSLVSLILGALFTCFSFLTKQDGGGMALLISWVLLGYYALREKKWMPLFIFTASFAIFLLLIIAPFFKYSFGYWFNHGQPPHTARISPLEIANEFFGASQQIKFYLFLVFVIILMNLRSWKEFWKQEQTLFLLLTVCILGEAAIFQVTSYTPPDNNIFFHSFAIAFILSSLPQNWSMRFNTRLGLVIGLAGVLLWWSSVYWNYIQRIVERAFPPSYATVSPTGENIITKRTYMISNDPPDIPVSEWKFSPWKSFDKIYMPSQTIDGIQRVLNMDVVKNKKENISVLNMSELTPLAVEMPYKDERGPEIPLWHHLGVGMFNREARMYEQKIADKKYDLVLFEYIPGLNNFYPFRVRDSLQVHYQKVDSFPAPRRGTTIGMIEVYTK